MTRSQPLRDARREGDERVFASPIRVVTPLIGSTTVLVLAVVIAALSGLSAVTVVLIAAGTLVGCLVLAQRTVASLLAGLTLLIVRPYAAGERVRIQSPVGGCPMDVEIVHIGMANTTLAADAGVLLVPNHVLLRNPPAAAPAREPRPEPCP
ncbi:MAG: Mechanosensitive ion channel [Pseudonocardiales bacterium]|nr:Mechanosensitive ion channel [Pseudonocardiales bacterium]